MQHHLSLKALGVHRAFAENVKCFVPEPRTLSSANALLKRVCRAHHREAGEEAVVTLHSERKGTLND